MRGAVTSHDGHVLFREDRSTRAQNWASRREAFTFRQEKIKRFASSGISGHSKSGRTQTKLNGRGGMSFRPLRRDRQAVRVFAFTSCDSKNYDCLHQFGKFSHSCCVESQTSVTRQASCQRKEPLLTEIDVNVCKVRPPPAVHDCDGRRSRQKTRRCRSSVTKKHRRCSRRKSSINIAQWGVVRLVVVVKGSGVDEWPCIRSSTYWYTYTLGCPSNFFLYESQGEGGSPSKFFGNTDLKKLRKLRTTPY